MKERQQSNLEQLQSREINLSKLIGQRRAIYESVGTADVKLDSAPLKKIVQIGRIKSKVAAWLEDANTEFSQVQERIVVLEAQQDERLVEEAQKFLAQTSATRTQLEELRTYIAEGHLPQEVLENQESQYLTFVSRQETDPFLKRGLELLEQQKQKAQEQEVTVATVETSPQDQTQAAVETAVEAATAPQAADGNRAKLEARIEEMEIRVQKGYLPESVLPRARQELEKLKAGLTVETTPDGTLLKSQDNSQLSSEEMQQLSIVLINKEERTVKIGQKTVRFTDTKSSVFFAFLNKIAQTANVDLTSEDLNGIAGVDGMRIYSRGSRIFTYLKDRLEEDPKRPKIFTRTGWDANAIYRFNAQVEFGEATQVAAVQVGPVRLESQPGEEIAADALTSLPKTETAPPEEKALPKLTIDLSDKSIEIDGRTVQFRQFSGGENPAWQFLIRLAQNANTPLDPEKIRELTKDSLYSKKPSRGITYLREKIEVDLTNPQIIAKTGTDRNPIYQFNAQVEFKIKSSTLTAAERQEESQVASQAVETAVSEEKETGNKLIIDREAKELLVQQNDDIRTVRLSDRSFQVLEYLVEFPHTSVNSKELDKIAQEGGYQGDYPGRKAVFEIRQKIESDPSDPQILIRDPNAGGRPASYILNADVEFVELSPKTPDDEASTQKETNQQSFDQSETTQVPFETPQPGPKTIERRDPEVRQKINGYLDQISERASAQIMNVTQIAHAFPTLKASFIDRVTVEKDYITPIKGRSSGNPLFDAHDISVMLYIKENGNNLTKRLVRELKEIVREEIAKREREQEK